jgi:hypothetical protein
MPRLLTLALVIVCMAVTPGCGSGQTTAANSPQASAAIGDACLVGKWNLQQDVNTTGYKINGEPVRVTGLQGAKMTFTADGKGIEDFNGSHPLVGLLNDGSKLSITLAGSWAFGIHADGHQYVETGPETQLTTTATVDATPITYQASYLPASGRYSCTFGSLTMVTNTGVQTDQWSRG